MGWREDEGRRQGVGLQVERDDREGFCRRHGERGENEKHTAAGFERSRRRVCFAVYLFFAPIKSGLLCHHPIFSHAAATPCRICISFDGEVTEARGSDPRVCAHMETTYLARRGMLSGLVS